MISLDKKYQTKSGLPVTLISVNGRGSFPVLGYMADDDNIHFWSANGHYCLEGMTHIYLVETPPVLVKDTKLMVSKDGVFWVKAHLAFMIDGKAFCYPKGRNSWTGREEIAKHWEYYRIPTNDELKDKG